jgi:hypothetical protein
MINAKVIAHSVANNEELITFQTKAPKFLDAEFEKHRMISSNSSSDRAIPLNRMLEREYFLPADVRINRAGMQGTEHLREDEKEMFYEDLKDLYGHTADVLKKWDKVHKQHLNRYLLGFSYQDKVATANRSSFEHFFSLRLHEAADPAMYELARCMKQAMEESEPEELAVGMWHLPYVDRDKDMGEIFKFLKGVGNPQFVEEEYLPKLSSSRCARVSYMKHDNTSPSIQDDLELYNQLAVRPYTDKRETFYPENDPVHLSPLEHQAKPMEWSREDTYIDVANIHELVEDWDKGTTHLDKDGNLWSGNLRGWIQHRKIIECSG